LDLFPDILVWVGYLQKAPFVFIFLAVSLFFILSYILNHTSKTIKAVSLNLAVIFFFLGFWEAYLAGLIQVQSIKDRDLVKDEDIWYSGTLRVRDPLLDYALKKNAAVREKVSIGNQSAYDVTYTTNRYGWRVSPHDIMRIDFKPGYRDVFFFGCSIAFGTGLADDETLPFIFEKGSSGKYKSFNFANQGYGPQQMLVLLNSGRIDSVASDNKPAIAIYEAVDWQIERAACKYPYVFWASGNPHYVLNRFGELELDFRSPGNPSIRKIIYQSRICRTILNSLICRSRSQKDISLFMEIVKEAKKAFEDKYQGEFYVLFWDRLSDPATSKKLLSAFKDARINVFKISDILPAHSYTEFKKLYLLKHDMHPNALVNKLIAKYLLERIK